MTKGRRTHIDNFQLYYIIHYLHAEYTTIHKPSISSDVRTWHDSMGAGPSHTETVHQACNVRWTPGPLLSLVLRKNPNLMMNGEEQAYRHTQEEAKKEHTQ